MGWLRDLMQGAEPPYASFGALARAAMAHTAWPPSVRAHERSLSTVFSKLDRDTDLDWLVERTDVQRILAELLGCTVADIQAAVVAGPKASDHSVRRVRLDDLRYARALDLAAEPLPPGIPDAVLHPETWHRLWWVAPSGAGRTLAGRWLEARGLAVYAAGRDLDQVRDALATRAPVFVELTGSGGGELPRRARLCVAAAEPPASGDWTLVESAPVSDYLPELVAWVAERLESDGHFEAARAERWLRGAPLDSLGTAIGLCGLIDELGFRSLEGRSLADAARRYVDVRLAEWRRTDNGDTAGIERRAFDVLVAMVMRTLTDDDQRWNAPRSFDAWVELVPPEQRQGADVDWLRLSLPRVDRTIRPSDIEKAARRMPPGAYRIVRALRGARLLVAGAHDDELCLAPRWLGMVAEREARRALLSTSPFEWGEALLRPHAAAGALAELVERARQADLGPIAAALELGDDENPAYVAALESGFIAVGLAVLHGLEISPELADELWSEQARLLIELPGARPKPRVLDPDRHDVWIVAALALGELNSRPGAWTDRQAWRTPLLDAAERVLGRSPPELAAAIAALIDRRRAAQGAGAAHAVERTSILMEAIEAGSASFDLVRAHHDPERDVAAIERVAAQRNIELARVARALWESWSRAGRPALPPLLRAGAGARFHAELPPALVGPVLESAAGDGIALPFEAWGDTQWAVFVTVHANLALGSHEAAVWDAIPLLHALRALTSDAPPGRQALSRLWSRFADALSEAHSAELSEGQHERAVELLGAAPDVHAVRLLRAWRERVLLDRLPDSVLNRLRGVLSERVSARREGWREAYALLAEAERLVQSSRL